MNISHPLPDYLQRLWFLHETAGVRGLLNIGVDLEIRGAHDPVEVRAAFHAAVRRHDAFRLRFGLDATGPTWHLADETAVVWEVAQVPSGAEALDSGELAREAAARHSTCFDLAAGPLGAATLFIVEPRRSVLAITAHQLVADARAIRVVVEDFLEEWRLLRGELVPTRQPPTGYVAWLVANSPSGLSQDPGSRHEGAYKALREQQRGLGAECGFRLGEQLARRLRAQSGRCGVTAFTSLMAGFHLLCSEAGLLAPFGVGLVISDRDPRRFGHTAGCFVRMVPLRINLPTDLTTRNLLRATKDAICEARKDLSPVTGASTPGCRAMVSMVRDSAVRLAAPSGIEVRKHRRLRVQSECDLHLFLHDLGADIEVVLNHDVSKVTDAAAQALGTRYLDVLQELADSAYPRIALGQSEGRLHHVGLAAWEIELATLRLAAQGIRNLDPTTVDEVAGVAMRIAGSIGDVALELVAPLRQDAPCVGPLAREGEGAYHCCWEVKTARSVHDVLLRRGVVHTPLTDEVPTPLFPGVHVSFAVVPGIGLVEWLCPPRSGETRGSEGPSAHLRIEIESRDIANAARFLEALGYRRQGDGSWARPGGHHKFLLWPSQRNTDQVALVCGARVGLRAEVPMATSWWSRVRFELCDAHSANRIEKTHE